MATTVLDLATDDVAVVSIAARVFAVVDRPSGAVDDRDALVKALPIGPDGAAGMELRTIRRRAGLDPTEARALWSFLTAD